MWGKSKVTNAAIVAGVDAVKIGGGLIDNDEFAYLNNVSSNLQSQINAKEAANANIQSHISSTLNPHSVTYTQAGAEPANANIQSHISAVTGNPHAVGKSDVGLGSVENAALSTFAGTANVVTVGTVATGTWNATAISIAKGGTGQATAQAALDALLPSQSGQSGKVLGSDGTNGGWVAASGGLSESQVTGLILSLG